MSIVSKLFARNSDSKPDAKPDATRPTQPSEAIVTEGISGVWHYHVSHAESFTRGLCGAQTMKTAIPLADFGKPFGEHFPKRPTWCAACHESAAAQGLGVPANMPSK